jgi:hypothetical protein
MTLTTQMPCTDARVALLTRQAEYICAGAGRMLGHMHRGDTAQVTGAGALLLGAPCHGLYHSDTTVAS